MQADGSIVIDTKLNTSGMNQGVKSLGSSLKGILDIVKTIGKTLLAAFVGGSIINSLRGLISGFDFFKSSLADKFKPLSDALNVLKGTFINLIATALVPLIPYIVSAVQWFTHLLEIATQLIGAFFGMKKTIGGVAGETKNATKEAKGALAAFDQINVLQQQQAGNTDQPFVTPGALDVPQSFLDKVDEIKKKIMEIGQEILAWWKDPIGKLQETWGKIVSWFRENVLNPLVAWWNTTWLGQILSQLWENFKTTWSNILANTANTFAQIKARIIQILNGIGEFVFGVFTGNWALAWQGLKDIVYGIGGLIFAIVTGVFANILFYIDGWKRQLIIIWNALPQPIKDAFTNALNWIMNTWNNLSNWFSTSVIQPIKNAFGSALTGIKDNFVSIFNSILSHVGNIIGGIIDHINNLIDKINSISSVFGNVSIPVIYPPVTGTAGGGTSGGGSAGGHPQLASGAVIPPNSRFAAILGDQRSGMNIEAPADLIRQMVIEALNSSQQQTNVTVSFEGGSLATLVRELQPHIKAENIRVGKSLS